jgi:chromatin segregation and condensation protein Rec8/ScpA/Scc1 (kleisin family)
VSQQAVFALERKPPTQATLHTAQVVRHLLWHKAMVGDDEDGRRITDYIEMVTTSADGEHVAIKDGFHRDLAIAFELVIREHLDPWDIDLSKFAKHYLEEAGKHGFDLVTSGRILLLAHEVLKLQSQEAADRAVIRSEPDEPGWEDIPDFAWSDDQVDYNSRLLALPRAPIDEKIRHKGDRRVTLMELLSAFEEVHEEAQARLILNEQKLQARLSLKRRMRGRVGLMMHREDQEAEIAETWERIQEYPGSPVPFSGLHERSPADVVQTFNSLLFLAKSQRITLQQEDFPYGEVWVTPKVAE